MARNGGKRSDAHCRTGHFQQMDTLTASCAQSKVVHRHERISP
jgi:hypothetical protein